MSLAELLVYLRRSAEVAEHVREAAKHVRTLQRNVARPGVPSESIVMLETKLSEWACAMVARAQADESDAEYFRRTVADYPPHCGLTAEADEGADG